MTNLTYRKKNVNWNTAGGGFTKMTSPDMKIDELRVILQKLVEPPANLKCTLLEF